MRGFEERPEQWQQLRAPRVVPHMGSLSWPSHCSLYSEIFILKTQTLLLFLVRVSVSGCSRIHFLMKKFYRLPHSSLKANNLVRLCMVSPMQKTLMSRHSNPRASVFVSSSQRSTTCWPTTAGMSRWRSPPMTLKPTAGKVDDARANANNHSFLCTGDFD